MSKAARVTKFDFHSNFIFSIFSIGRQEEKSISFELNFKIEFDVCVRQLFEHFGC